MEFENTFQVAAPIDEVWTLLLDVQRIAPCVPGAQVLEQVGDDAYKVAVKVKLGPMTMNYKGDIQITGKDDATHEATMSAKAKEARGQGTARADIRMALREGEGGTTASIVTAMQMSGKAAAMGQGVIKDVAGAITDTFAGNLAGMIEREGAVAAGVPKPAAAPPVAALDESGASTLAAAALPDPGAPPPPAFAPPEPPRPAFTPPAAEPAVEASLPVGKLVVAVVSGRLKDPRTLGALVALTLAFAAGRWSR